jgi:putative membrane protein
MSKHPSHRKPAAFRLDDPKVTVADDDSSALRRGGVRIVPEIEALAPAVIPAIAIASPRKSWLPSWSSVFWSAIGGLLILGTGLGLANLVQDLFARSETLGYVGVVLSFAAALALIAIIFREAAGLWRLGAIERLHVRASAVLASDDRDEGRAIVRDLLSLQKRKPQLAHRRATLEAHLGEIIDGADLVRLAERELMEPLDREARRLVSTAAQRVSLVTAISPRAVVDVLFVLAAGIRLVRQLAYLYGGRPGALGMIRLLRLAIAHLAITGGLAASDSLIQQVVGHGIAAKLSTRLGEGVMNGLLTARLGLAAIDVTRPLPFEALPRPAIGDLARDLVARSNADRDAGPAITLDGG